MIMQAILECRESHKATGTGNAAGATRAIASLASSSPRRGAAPAIAAVAPATAVATQTSATRYTDGADHL